MTPPQNAIRSGLNTVRVSRGWPNQYQRIAETVYFLQAKKKAAVGETVACSGAGLPHPPGGPIGQTYLILSLEDTYFIP